jgi:hypothetical protein
MSDRSDQPGNRLVDLPREGEQLVPVQDRKAMHRREHDAIPVHGVLRIEAVGLEHKIEWMHRGGDRVAKLGIVARGTERGLVEPGLVAGEPEIGQHD